MKRVIRNTGISRLWHVMLAGRLYYRLAKSGNLTPPPYEVKRSTILLYARFFQIDTFVETGTYLGDTVSAVSHEFSRIYSIELQPSLYEQAMRRFANFDHIHIINGDSGQILPEILAQNQNPCLFWLDGHYSGGNTGRGTKDTPIVEEMQCILSHGIERHVVLIDDARLFTGAGDYPSLGKVKSIVARGFPTHAFDVRNDIIRVCPALLPSQQSMAIP